MKLAKVTPITVPKDNKAELALITRLHGKSETERRDFCKIVDCPWEEYQRLLRKWQRVIVRWNIEKKGEIKDE